MTIIIGFIIFLMILLLAYSLYRAIKKRSLLMLIPVCLQVFAVVMAVMGFINDVAILPVVEAVYVLFGIIPPSVLLVHDYTRMVMNIKTKGEFEGLVRSIPPDRPFSSFPTEGINGIRKKRQLHEIIDELGNMPEDIRMNFRKCIIEAHTYLNKETARAPPASTGYCQRQPAIRGRCITITGACAMCSHRTRERSAHSRSPCSITAVQMMERVLFAIILGILYSCWENTRKLPVFTKGPWRFAKMTLKSSKTCHMPL